MLLLKSGDIESNPGPDDSFSLNVYFMYNMYNINIFEHIQDMCLLHYNII